MPAVNPRLTITLKPSLAAQLRKLSGLTGNSQAALISDLLEGTEEVLAKMIVVLEAANEAHAELRGKLAADLGAAHEQLESQLGLALGDLDRIGSDLVTEVETIKRRRPARRGGDAARRPAPARGASPTPMSNRGVRSATPRTKVKEKRS